MKITKNQIIYLLLGIIVVLIIGIILMFTVFTKPNFKWNNQNNSQNTQTQNKIETNQNQPGENTSNEQQPNETLNQPSKTPTPTPTITPVPTPIITPTPTPAPVEPTYSEQDVIAYFETEERSIDGTTWKEKAKNTFTNVVDFIFYEKEIKGYTFKELTTSAKLKVIELGLSIDSKIESYFPDYKNTLSEKYQNIKGKLAYFYLEITSSLCESVGETTCNQAKEDFNNMKESFSFTWELLKELTKSGTDKVFEFYEKTFKE